MHLHTVHLNKQKIKKERKNQNSRRCNGRGRVPTLQNPLPQGKKIETNKNLKSNL
jgi:hypothetical protein